MGRGDISLACATALVDQLARGGVDHACISPGSRSTPLALALARDSAVTVHVHLDERSAAFFALGLAKSLRRPVAVACTSGTAAAEFFPAVVEASQSRVPLIVLTADRPPRLRETGANQTIDQVDLYGKYTRAYYEPPVPTSADDIVHWEGVGRRAIATALAPTSGPVQIDCPFEEPLIPIDEPITAGNGAATVDLARAQEGPSPSTEETERAVEAVTGRRGLVVVGGSAGPPPGLTVHLAERLAWPVIAEPASDARRPGQSLTAGPALASSASWLDAHRPEVVLQVGAAPTTRTVAAVAAAAGELIVVDAFHRDPDVDARASLRIHTDPDRLVATLEPYPLETAPAGWLDDWRLADTAARRAIDAGLDQDDQATELQVARDLAAAAPPGATLFVGNSMPIRDLDYAMAPREGLRILANRGASGIDGLVSTALGIAAAATEPTLALIGDLSFLYDAGALLWGGHRARNLTIVVPNNRGGRIFSLLGQRDLPELDRLFVTPHDVDLRALCDAARVGHALIQDVWAFEAALQHGLSRGGLQVIEVAIDPERSIIQRREIQAAVDVVLADLI